MRSFGRSRFMNESFQFGFFRPWPILNSLKTRMGHNTIHPPSPIKASSFTVCSLYQTFLKIFFRFNLYSSSEIHINKFGDILKFTWTIYYLVFSLLEIEVPEPLSFLKAFFSTIQSFKRRIDIESYSPFNQSRKKIFND